MRYVQVPVSEIEKIERLIDRMYYSGIGLAICAFILGVALGSIALR